MAYEAINEAERTFSSHKPTLVEALHDVANFVEEQMGPNPPVLASQIVEVDGEVCVTLVVSNL